MKFLILMLLFLVMNKAKSINGAIVAKIKTTTPKTTSRNPTTLTVIRRTTTLKCPPGSVRS